MIPPRTLRWYALGVLFLVCGCVGTGGETGEFEPKLRFDSSDAVLVERFAWARRRALTYVRSGDPVGNWIEAALPGREAFCIRDVSHQSAGANALGLEGHVLNMLRRFAENISESKDWCTYWEINRWNLPAPVDYRNDEAFWYDLPANFDLLDCCYRQYLWTGDRAYVDDSTFLDFYDRTVEDYVRRWDLDLEGIMTRERHVNLAGPLDPSDPFQLYRGLPSYYEDGELLLGADLQAFQYAAYRAYAAVQELKGNQTRAQEFQSKADAVRRFYNDTWWDGPNRRFNVVLYPDHRFESFAFPYHLYLGIPDEGEKTEGALDNLLQWEPLNIEVESHYPEILYGYGRNEEAYRFLMRLTADDRERREYPEVSYAVLGAVVTGLMGVSPDARRGTVTTVPGLTSETEWAAIAGLDVLGNVVEVRHEGVRGTRFTHRGAGPLHWRACFPGPVDDIAVDGRNLAAIQVVGRGGRLLSCAEVDVDSGTTRRAAVAAN